MGNRRQVAVLMGLVLFFTMIPLWTPTESRPAANAAIIPLEFSQAQRGPVILSEPVMAPFAMAGLSWEGEAPEEAWVRYKARGQQWSSWQSLELEPDTQADPGSIDAAREKPASEPLWTGSADEVQYRVRLADSSTQFRAALVDPSNLRRPPVQRALDWLGFSLPAAEASHPNPVSIRSRASWDPNNDCRPEDPADPEYTQVSMAFVHHTTGSNSYSKSQVPNLILAICRYHVNVRGWRDIGYNFIVDRFGGIWEARAGGIDRGVVGAHTGGFNTYSFGVGLLGDHRVTPISTSATASLTNLLAWKLANHNVPVVGKLTLVSKGSSKYEQGTEVTFNRIAGHRDASATTCPGAAAYNQLGPIRSAVSSLWSPIPSGSYRQNLAADFTGNAHVDGASFRRNDASWWVVTDLGPRKWAEFSAKSGWTTQVPGDFNGDGRDDIANFNIKNGTWWVSISTGDRFVTKRWADYTTNSGWSTQIAGDFNGDGREDIANFHPANGTWWVSISTGDRFVTKKWAGFSTATGWISQVVGDFNGDDRDDIANFNIKNGTWWVSISTGDRFVTKKWAGFSTATGWGARLVGDFNRDGRDDITQYHPKNDGWWTSLSTGASFATKLWGVSEPDDKWSLFSVFDLNADGRDDIAMIDAYDGNWWIAASDGTAFRFKQRGDGIWRDLFTGVGVGGSERGEIAYFNAQEFVWSRASTDGNWISVEQLGKLPHP
jgi:hypothetical protein